MDLGYNTLLVERTGHKVDDPDDNYALLMYYLDCVHSLLPSFFEDSKYKNCFDYNNYDSIKYEDKCSIIELAELFNPKI